MAIEKIGQIITVEQLYENQEQATGDAFVDGVVSVLREVKRPSAEAVATLLGVSRHSLSEVIKVRTGANLSDLLEYWTWQKAKQLLTETEMPFDEVAHECGFSGYSALHRFVERKAGKTLVEIRTNCERRRWKQNMGYV